MKQLVAAVSLVLLASPVFADAGQPFEQLDIDRALPDLGQGDSTAASSGSTRSDGGIATEASGESPWANDHNVISPAQ